MPAADAAAAAPAVGVGVATAQLRRQLEKRPPCLLRNVYIDL